MAESYTLAFEHVRQEIFLYSPQAALQLHTIRDSCDDQAAYYAAFVLMCIHARVEKDGLRVLNHLGDHDIRGYTFFDYVKGNPYALIAFAEVFKTYQDEQKARFEPQSASHEPPDLTPGIQAYST
jgi:hypothetical protein